MRTAIVARCFEGLETAGARQMAEAFGSIDGLFDAGAKAVTERFPGTERIAGRLFSPCSWAAASRDIDWALEHGLEITTLEDDSYPSRLKACPDAPLMLYSKGRCNFERSRFIAVVGTRACTQWGRRYCESVVEGLSRLGVKPVVVSGLALGIDTYAHSFALRYGLDTVAVMGTGFDTIYPHSNEQLAEQIARHGAIVSEFSPFTPSYPINFVRRNRIIAGLADCTLVVESKEKGGGLITAKFAMDYNRGVFAIPGRMDDNTFKGCNRIIEDNIASMATGPDSVIRAMGWDEDGGRLPLSYDGPASGDPLKAKILGWLRAHPESDMADIAAGVGAQLQQLALPLLEMELAGAIGLGASNKYFAK